MTKRNGKAKKATKKTAKRKPKGKPAKQEIARNGNGQWEPGQSGNPKGRLPQFDFRKSLQRYIEENDFDMDAAAGELAKSLFDLGKAGDVQAAKLWLDRCYGTVTQEHHIEAETTVTKGPSIPVGEEMHAWMDQLTRIVHEGE